MQLTSDHTYRVVDQTVPLGQLDMFLRCGCSIGDRIITLSKYDGLSLSTRIVDIISICDENDKRPITLSPMTLTVRFKTIESPSPEGLRR
jgi:hypothetical protein